MKRRFITLILLLILCCVCCGGCENRRLQFDENSNVTLQYSCFDESKNFNLQLSPDASQKVIKGLNSITYVEVKENIVFGPSYDRLLITVGSDKVALYDVRYALNGGGYFEYNGQLCETNDSFAFLSDYVKSDN